MLLNLFEPYLLLSNSFLNYRGLPELRGSDSRGKRKIFEKKWRENINLPLLHTRARKSFLRIIAQLHFPTYLTRRRGPGRSANNPATLENFSSSVARAPPHVTRAIEAQAVQYSCWFTEQRKIIQRKMFVFSRSSRKLCQRGLSEDFNRKSNKLLVIFMCVCVGVGRGWFWHIIQPKNI